MKIYPRGSRNSPKPHLTLTTLLGKKLLTAHAQIVQNHSLKNRVPSRRLSFARMSIGIASSWIVSHIASPAYATTLINNSGIQFDQDTTLETNFLESHGAYQSIFGVINLDTKEKTPLLVETKPSDDPESIFKPSSFLNHLGTNTDFKGTPGNAVPQPIAQYKFRANQRYVLYLESSYKGRPTGVLYSTDVLNPNQERQVQFSGGLDDLCKTGITIGWDDTGSKLVRNRQQQDRDFDDFIVQLKNTACGVGGDQVAPPQTASVPPTVASLPPAPPAGGFNPLWLTPLGLLALIGGGSGNPGGNPGGGVTPTPVPEPFTILGSGCAIAVGTLIQRRRKRQRQ